MSVSCLYFVHRCVFVSVILSILQSSPMLKRSRQPGGSVVRFELRKSSFPSAKMAKALLAAPQITTARRMMKIELMMMMMSQMIMRDELSLLHDIRPSRRELQRNLVVESEDFWHINDFFQQIIMEI